MPKKIERCVKKVQRKGHSKSSAFAICSKSTGIKRKKGGGWTKGKKAKKR
jgi:hypothetical protein